MDITTKKVLWVYDVYSWKKEATDFNKIYGF